MIKQLNDAHMPQRKRERGGRGNIVGGENEGKGKILDK